MAVNTPKKDAKKAPSYEVFSVEEGENGFWTKIGATWENSDGSHSLRLSHLPLNTDNLQLRIPLTKAEREAAKKKAANK